MRAVGAVNSHHFTYRDGELAVDETRTRVGLRPRPRFKKRLRPLYRLLGPALRLTDPYAATDVTSTTVSVEHLRINHYAIKSREEFGRKALLKREKKRYQSLDYFAYHDRNDVLDPILVRYLPHLGRSASDRRRTAMERTIFNEEQILFRKNVRAWVDREIVPYKDVWEEANIVPRELWKSGGAQGYLCPWLEEQHGGPGADFLCSVIVIEELALPSRASLSACTRTWWCRTSTPSAPTPRSNAIYRGARAARSSPPSP
jgi:hypothetical protein